MKNMIYLSGNSSITHLNIYLSCTTKFPAAATYCALAYAAEPSQSTQTGHFWMKVSWKMYLRGPFKTYYKCQFKFS